MGQMDSRWPITVDGTGLHNYAWNVRSRAGRDLAPETKTSNIDTDQRHGELWVPGKKFGPGRMVLKMWVNGCTADGQVPVNPDDYYQYRMNLDALRLLFGRRERLLDVRQVLKSDGSIIRQALAEVTAVIDPELAAPRPYTAELTVEFAIPGSFWQDLADVNYDSGTGVVSNSLHQLAAFAGATGPMEDLFVVVDGPGVNIRVADEPSGHYQQYNGALLSTEQWVVDTTNWTSKKGTGIAFTSGGTDVYPQTVYGGVHAPRIFALTANLPNPQVRITGTGFGAGTRLRLRGRRKYQ